MLFLQGELYGRESAPAGQAGGQQRHAPGHAEEQGDGCTGDQGHGADPGPTQEGITAG
jgi:hypothetical protein